MKKLYTLFVSVSYDDVYITFIWKHDLDSIAHFS